MHRISNPSTPPPPLPFSSVSTSPSASTAPPPPPSLSRSNHVLGTKLPSLPLFSSSPPSLTHFLPSSLPFFLPPTFLPLFLPPSSLSHFFPLSLPPSLNRSHPLSLRRLCSCSLPGSRWGSPWLSDPEMSEYALPVEASSQPMWPKVIHVMGKILSTL